jgi:sulfatase maturation enzyme AslB (radical SAM superfamily)
MAISKDEDNKTLCSAFWRHTNVRGDNTVFPCCRYKQSVATFTGNVSEILTSSVYDKLRQDSASGVINPNCEKCYHEESIGTTSMRQFFNNKYVTTKVELEFLEIGFDNICNLICDGCNSEFSLAWADIEQPNTAAKLKIRSIDPITSLPASIKKILFLGGEPLMTSRHKDLLNLVVDKSCVNVVYNTNGTFLLNQQTINLLHQFQSVEFVLSVDGYGKLNEQVRSGSKWEDILKFIEQIKSLGFDLLIHTVIHINTWRGLKDVFDFVQENHLHWRVNVLTYPKKLDIINLNPDEREEFIDILNNITIPNNQDQLYDVSSIINHFQKTI